MSNARSADDDVLIDALTDARSIELSLVSGLTDEQLLGTPGHFVEPPIWEMGHVGWFQEYWILRHLDGVDSLVPGSDGCHFSGGMSTSRPASSVWTLIRRRTAKAEPSRSPTPSSSSWRLRRPNMTG
jgi:hypothetical protein